MKKEKLKTHVLMVSTTFPTSHKRKGENTFFTPKIEAIGCKSCTAGMCEICSGREWKDSPKIHTIRANYYFWKKRIEEVQRGEAVLSLRYWNGKPFRSKQVEFMQLTNDDCVGIQKLTLHQEFFKTGWIVGQSDFTDQHLSRLAINDGLSLQGLQEWFKNYNFKEPLAIIHFTRFRY